jgi:hypothetical protein
VVDQPSTNDNLIPTQPPQEALKQQQNICDLLNIFKGFTLNARGDLVFFLACGPMSGGRPYVLAAMDHPLVEAPQITVHFDWGLYPPPISADTRRPMPMFYSTSASETTL